MDILIIKILVLDVQNKHIQIIILYIVVIVLIIHKYGNIQDNVHMILLLMILIIIQVHI